MSHAYTDLFLPSMLNIHSRNKNSNLSERDCLVKHKDMTITNDINPLYHHMHVTAPHYVIELSMTDWKRMALYSINLNGYKVATVNK